MKTGGQSPAPTQKKPDIMLQTYKSIPERQETRWINPEGNYSGLSSALYTYVHAYTNAPRTHKNLTKYQSHIIWIKKKKTTLRQAEN